MKFASFDGNDHGEHNGGHFVEISSIFATHDDFFLRTNAI